MTCLNVFFGLLYYLGKAGKEGLKGSKHEKRSVGGCCGGDLPKRVWSGKKSFATKGVRNKNKWLPNLSSINKRSTADPYFRWCPKIYYVNQGVGK